MLTATSPVLPSMDDFFAAPLVALESTDDGVAAQLALIHQELVKLNALLAAHFQSRNGANQWEIAADSAW